MIKYHDQKEFKKGNGLYGLQFQVVVHNIDKDV